MQQVNVLLPLLGALICCSLGYNDDVTCGRSSVRRVKRIVGGSDVMPGHWPWQVSLQVIQHGPTGKMSYHFCGGSIINSNWIVTATHCGVKNLNGTIKILVGINKIGSFYLWKYDTKIKRYGPPLEDINPFLQTFDIEKSVRHPSIDPNNKLEGEVFLIKLSRSIQFNNHISPICLPEQDQLVPVGTKCWTSGWGVTGEYSRVSPETLQEVDLAILSQEQCTDWYSRSDFDMPPGYVTENMLCAGYEEGGKSSCFGDSGGPLMCYIDNQWTLFGIVSHGGYCGYPRNPGIYVHVPRFIDWIRNTIDHN